MDKTFSMIKALALINEGYYVKHKLWKDGYIYLDKEKVIYNNSENNPVEYFIGNINTTSLDWEIAPNSPKSMLAQKKLFKKSLNSPFYTCSNCEGVLAVWNFKYCPWCGVKFVCL